MFMFNRSVIKSSKISLQMQSHVICREYKKTDVEKLAPAINVILNADNTMYPDCINITKDIINIESAREVTQYEKNFFNLDH